MKWVASSIYSIIISVERIALFISIKNLYIEINWKNGHIFRFQITTTTKSLISNVFCSCVTELIFQRDSESAIEKKLLEIIYGDWKFNDYIYSFK